MAQYQIPQFLDAGDKILGPLNLRQFGYVLVGGIIAFGIYSFVFALFPGLGFFAFLPAAPALGLTLYIAMGKYNGRDVEVYILKMIANLFKPKTLIYKRVPELADLDQKMARANQTAIEKEWAERLEEEQKTKNSKLHNFRTASNEKKVEQIRSLSFGVDTSIRNTLANVKQKELEIEATKHQVGLLTNIKNKNRQYSRSPLLEAPTPLQEIDNTVDEMNFFETPTPPPTQS